MIPRLEVRQLDPTGAQVGDVPTRTAAGIEWAPPGSGGGGGITEGSWQNLTLNSGYASHAGSFGYPPQIRKVGDTVYLRGNITRSPSANFATGVETTIATLPAGFRPVAPAGSAAAANGAIPLVVFLSPATGSMAVRWSVTPNGVLSCYLTSATTFVGLHGWFSTT